MIPRFATRPSSPSGIDIQTMTHKTHWDDETVSLLPKKNMTTKAIHSPDVPPWEESKINFPSGFVHQLSFLVNRSELIDAWTDCSALKFPLEVLLDSQDIFRTISPLLLALAAYQTGRCESTSFESIYVPTKVIITDQDHSTMIGRGFGVQGHVLANDISHLANNITRDLEISRSK